MKVVTHSDFLQVYTNDPAAAPGRIEPILEAIRDAAEFEEPLPAAWDDIEAVHTQRHMQRVEREGVYGISALAAGAAMLAAEIGLSEPCFSVARPPGHHASADSSWGFCYFNNMAVALEHLRREGRIQTAYVLDFDLHYGDGTVSILREKGYVAIHNPESDNREVYLGEIEKHLQSAQVDVIGVSAGFDNHVLDWGGLLLTEDYRIIGQLVRRAANRMRAGCFGLLEGGYNHGVLGQNVLAFLNGLAETNP
ncbi:MAG: histone deacetylase family protein [Syntrophobacteraceae bacterium]|jgi:acetoin utilization deacetylase AcuC-like enzyme|nr:histone deacetylase family protein [Syntrophobacteraceae bacterium]